MQIKSHFFWTKIVILFAALVVAFFWSFFVGRYELAMQEVVDILCSRIMSVPRYWADTLETIVIKIRFPRIVAAIFVGGALSVSGASYQTLFKNPMVSPDLLGVSAGASFGAALVMLYSGSWWKIQASAALFGLIAVGAAYLIGHILPAITFWLMGSLGKADNDDIRLLVPMVLLAMLVLFLFRHQIDAMAAGEAEAVTMGVNVTRVKAIVVLCSTVMTVVSVSICGTIGWVGLVVPHIARSIVGASYGRLIGASFLIGGIFLLLVDNTIRGTMAVDLPLGVMTALIGTPVFVALLAKSGKEWR